MERNSVMILLVLFSVTASFGQSWTLERCLQYAEANNNELLSNSQAIDASRRGNQASRARLLPEISASGDIDHFWRIPVMAFPAEVVGGEPGTFVPVRTSTPWTSSYGADATIAIIDPQAWQGLKLSSLQLQMQESQFRSFKQLLARNVRMAYYSIQAEYENRDATRLLYENYKKTHRLLELQFGEGLIDQIAINQSLVLLNDREEARTQAEANLLSAFLDLKFWMGFPLQEELDIEKEASAFDETDFDTPFNIDQVPDYHVARLRLAQEEQQWRISRSRFLPQLSGIANFQRIAFRNSFNFFEAGEWYNVGAFGLRLTVPLLSAREMFYEPAQQKALMKQAGYDFMKYQEEQEKNYLNQRIQLEQANKAWKNQKQNLRMARQNEELAVRRIEEGIIDLMQLKQIQDDLSSALQRLSRARLNYLRHYVELQYLQRF